MEDLTYEWKLQGKFLTYVDDDGIDDPKLRVSMFLQLPRESVAESGNVLQSWV